MSQYAPEVNPETGELIFPPIKQDNTEVFVNNLLHTMNEINTNYINQPLVLLSISTNDPTEIELDHELQDKHYSHTLIKQLISNRFYIPLNLAEMRNDTTYGKTTLIHLHNDRGENEKYLYEHNLQISMLLSEVYPTYPLEY